MIRNSRLKILLVVYNCNPEWASMPSVGYNIFHAISQLVDVTLVTADYNQSALQKTQETAEIVYLPESQFMKRYCAMIRSWLGDSQRTIWPLFHTLTYPAYAEFDFQVYRAFNHRVQWGEFDIVHAVTPMNPRYPYSIAKACKQVPFVLGPVNGGLPFPKAFQDKARQEYAMLNGLRAVGRWLLPEYRQTYQRVTHLLAGSSYTQSLVQSLFQLPDDRISLCFENGIHEQLLTLPTTQQDPDDLVELLFVGRLVPYKCADVVIEALGRLPAQTRQQVRLTILGDGQERQNLEKQVQDLSLQNSVYFAGWIESDHIYDFYRKAHVFCFPSIREFGGAVVMEAMACGLPCIVVNHGGIGEYATPESGFKIEPRSREYLVQEMAHKIQLLATQPDLRQAMATAAIQQAHTFTWQEKGNNIVDLYHKLLQDRVNAKDVVG
jgi:glycosyltransferase involved in cell wall biosynthesis